MTRLLDYPERLASSLLPAVDAVARATFGARDLAGSALSEQVAALSARYTSERSAPAEAGHEPAELCARLRFFLPRDLLKIQLPLAELARLRALPARECVRILDLGAGLGASGLGVAEFLAHSGSAAEVEIDAVDRDERGLEIYRRLAGEAFGAGPLQVRVRSVPGSCARIERLPLRPPYDFVLLGFVLNELDADLTTEEAVPRHAQLLARACALLGDDGAAIVLEPALREQSRRLQAVRDVFATGAAGAHVFGPCVHRRPCPMLQSERDWCHERAPVLLPPELGSIAHAAGLRSAHLSFSYLTLTRRERSLGELGAAAQRMVSAPLPSKGKLEVHLCSACGLTLLRRLDRDKSSKNAALDAAKRGHILAISPSPEGPAWRCRTDAEVRILHQWGLDGDAL